MRLITISVILLGIAIQLGATAERDNAPSIPTPALTLAAQSNAPPPVHERTAIKDQIKLWYEKYKGDDKLLDSYLGGLGDGFKMGVQGQPAHLLGLRYEITPQASSINGFLLGYTYGNELYASLSGDPMGFRKKKS